jgi:predicted nucleic acid-binding protein
MKSYVLDASSLLRFVEDEAGATRVEDLLNQARTGDARLILSAVNWGEVFYVIARLRGEAEAASYSLKFRSLPVEILDAGWQRAESAGLFHKRFNVPYADSFAGSLTEEESAVLVTADYDFKNAGGAIAVEFLPAKKQSTPRPKTAKRGRKTSSSN